MSELKRFQAAQGAVLEEESAPTGVVYRAPHHIIVPSNHPYFRVGGGCRAPLFWHKAGEPKPSQTFPNPSFILPNVFEQIPNIITVLFGKLWVFRSGDLLRWFQRFTSRGHSGRTEPHILPLRARPTRAFLCREVIGLAKTPNF